MEPASPSLWRLTALGVRPALWLSVLGGWAAGFWVLFSPLSRMRDIPKSQL